MAEIGEPLRRIYIEPFPVEEPVEEPAPVVEPEPVPA